MTSSDVTYADIDTYTDTYTFISSIPGLATFL